MATGDVEALNALHILLIDDDPQRCEQVEEHLSRAGYRVSTGAASASSLLRVVSDAQPDVILIDMASPSRDLLESLSFMTANEPKPVVLFSQEEDPDYIREAVAVGVSTYLVGDLDPARVRPLIDVALAQFRALEALRDELAQTRTALDERKLIDQAKSRLMEHHGLAEEEAFKLLRSQAMKRNLRLVEFAEAVLGAIPQRESST